MNSNVHKLKGPVAYVHAGSVSQDSKGRVALSPGDLGRLRRRLLR